MSERKAWGWQQTGWQGNDKEGGGVLGDQHGDGGGQLGQVGNNSTYFILYSSRVK